ncbi:MAG: integrase arm-type DNA-binding domain-containing protein [Sulfuricurvum sp.]|uniref:tyrosine-type recombinase/integrase n=1 Tax=Sulfuricurvum sp. TaxID=2025608 RepID=UPI002736044C|nr:integrase arm-type DNA-binding domain-containing protein [Sulfuricurvum sp.]MDP2851575.1 integrase arm-type DNA-binding domain-containing protein [Sulfuricurvum sp.]
MANKKVSPLTDTEIKNAKPKEKKYTLSDGNGLQLLIKPDTKKIWEIRYTLDGKPKTTTLGSYPTVSLAKARAKRDEFKAKVSSGIDPIQEKKETKKQKIIEEETLKAESVVLLNTFEKVSRDFIESITGELVPRYHSLKLARLENHIFPYVGDKPINEVTRIMIIECLDRLKLANKADTALRTLNIISQVYRYAVTREITPHNIVADIDKRFVIGKIERKNMPTITDPKLVGKLLAAIDNYHGEIIVKSALQLATLTAQRPHNIRFAQWEEFDLIKNEWMIPADQMKMKRPHIVPITKQIKEVLDNLRPHTQHKSKYLFHSLHTTIKPISENTMNQALRRLGYSKEEIVSHGFRAMFSTLANENITVHGYHTDVIERCLAHVEGNKVKGAYNHAQYSQERFGLMQWYADYLDTLKTRQSQ